MWSTGRRIKKQKWSRKIKKGGSEGVGGRGADDGGGGGGVR